MHLDHLPTELLLHIFQSCYTISDALHLASSNRRFQRIFNGSQKLSILMKIADAEFGPIEDIIQLVTQNASQPTHVHRNVSISDALLKQALEVGRVAQKWEVIYPLKKWKVDYENRRLLTTNESFRFRRALYRLWLYHRAFHNGSFDRFSRRIRTIVVERAQLLHNWSTAELAEIEDVRLIIQDVVQHHICPSNGTIQRKFHKRHPEHNHQLTFNIHLNYQPERSMGIGSYFWAEKTPSTEQYFHTAHPRESHKVDHSFGSKLRTDFFHDASQEGWGDEIPHYYVMQDMLKLDPAQVLWLQDHAPIKEQVERYVYSLGEWFRDNGETFGDTLVWVMNERGEDFSQLRMGIEDRELGVVSD